MRHSVRLGLHRAFTLGGAALLAVVLLLAPSCSRRGQSEPGAPARTAPPAPVVKVGRQNLTNELEIASEFRPFQEIEVHAKESGYVKRLYIDWGTHVRVGQLMAVLEIPELEEEIQRDKAAEQGSEQELARAHEELTRAQSAYQVAHLTSTRMAAVQKTQPGLVAQEEVDVAQGKDEETSAGVSASRDAVAAAEQESPPPRLPCRRIKRYLPTLASPLPLTAWLRSWTLTPGPCFLQVLQPARMGWLYATFLKTISCGW